VSYGSGGSDAGSVAVADLNGDGKLDIVVANACADASSPCDTTGSVGVLLGNGDGTFKTAVAYGSGGYSACCGPTWVAVADVNGDGKPDIVVTNACNINTLDCGNDTGSGTGTGTVGVLLGNGDGTFQTAVTYSSGGYPAGFLAIADLNGDGKPDLLVVNQCDNDESLLCFDGKSSSLIGVLLNNGDGTFQTAVTYETGGTDAGSLAIADVNGDGNPDIVAAIGCTPFGALCDGADVNVLLGNGDGTFQFAVGYNSGGDGSSFAESVAVADLNGDGKLDIVSAEDQLGVLLGNGDGTFQTAVDYNSGGSAGWVTIADVNGDGKLDLIVSNGTGNISAAILLGNGDGTFQAAVSAGAFSPSQTVVEDISGDGKPDIIFAAGGSVDVVINTSISATTTALTSSPNPSNFGQGVTLTATVTAQPGFYKGTPTGTVSFFNGSTKLGTSTLNSGGVTTFTISTLAVGTHSITASYNGSSQFASSTSSVVSQLVQGAVVKVSPTSLSFGDQTVNIASAPKNVTLSNSGNTALSIGSIALAGANVPSFSQTNNCGSTLAADGSCTIAVRFKPNSAVSKSASISIHDNAAGSPQSVALSGTGVLGAVTFSPDSLTFATQVVFTTSAAKTVKLTNSGLGILEISKISISGPFAQTHTCGTTVNPGASCTITVTFTPKADGLLTGALSVTDNGSGSTQEASLAGTGTAIQLSPTTLNFGNQPVNTASLAKTITLSNKSSAAVSISSITITGTNVGSFSQTHTCGASIAAGASCFIKVTFKPTATGARTAAVSVSDNGGGSPQKVSLAGTGT
jgi:hypothetical protein